MILDCGAGCAYKELRYDSLKFLALPALLACKQVDACLQTGVGRGRHHHSMSSDDGKAMHAMAAQF